MFAMAAYMVITFGIRKWNPKVCLTVFRTPCPSGRLCSADWKFFVSVEDTGLFPVLLCRLSAGFGDSLRVHTRKRWVRVLSVFVIAAGVFVSFYWIDDIFSIIRMFTGRNAYALIRVANCGWQHRALCYGISVIVSVAIINLMPGRRLAWAEAVGKNTLQIYFWHRLILYIMMFSGFCDAVRAYCGPFWIPVYLLLAVALTFVLAPDIVGWPLRKGQRAADARERRSVKLYCPYDHPVQIIIRRNP